MGDYTDFAQIVLLLLTIAGAAWGIFLLGHVLVYSVREVVYGPKVVAVPARPNRRVYGRQVKQQPNFATRSVWRG
jgi:hypothetical protein